ncbi:MAG: Heat shock protein, Hsp20 family [Candidatus Ozemobacter sibiricus]|jgi:HSP20 family protein|uniref:Heat shock protein, Hsp20 family n=1 Tax=Candidatus Ozemobacter sibiricus TaxID=2268124 RepID=A0A367ZIM3_9BACT|nr:MAG: Heat shock protein, Hsp20 family [Candidatus Ozemobacter sibiricus]
MNWQKLLPWNWFKKEEEEARVPVAQVPMTTENAMVPFPFHEFHREFDRLWNSMLQSMFPGLRFPALPMGSTTMAGFLRPTLDLSVTDAAYQATLEVPGVDPHDIKVEVRQGNLYITGEKKQEQETRDRDHYRIERAYGQFRRVLTLPEDADAEKIEARCRNGVLTVTIPRVKLPESSARLIEVKAG